MGILSPFSEHRIQGSASAATNTLAQTVGQVTPPETPAPERQLGTEGDVAEELHVSFNTTPRENLAEWAAGFEGWMYV